MEMTDKVRIVAKALAYQAAKKSKIPYAKEYAQKMFEYFTSAAQIILEDIEEK